MHIRKLWQFHLLSLSLLLSACGGETNELLPSPVQVTEAQILQHQSIWNANKLSKYRFVYSSLALCDSADALPAVTITVKNGQAVSATIPTYVEVKAGTPGAIAETISGPDGSSTRYFVVGLSEISGLRLVVNDVFQTMLELNQKQKIKGIRFHESTGSPETFESVGQSKCESFIVGLSKPEPI